MPRAAAATRQRGGPKAKPAARQTGVKCLADGHAVSNAPDLFRLPKLSGARPGYYWGGRAVLEDLMVLSALLGVIAFFPKCF